jgi:hypothetical protein
LGVGCQDACAVVVAEAGVVADAVEGVAQADFLSEGEVGAQQDVGGGRDRGEGVEDWRGGGECCVEVKPADSLAGFGFGGVQLLEQVLDRGWCAVVADVGGLGVDHGLAVEQFVQHGGNAGRAVGEDEPDAGEAPVDLADQ